MSYDLREFTFSGERDRARGEVRLPAAARLPHGPEEEEAQPQVQGGQGQEVPRIGVPGTASEAEEVGLGGPATIYTNAEVVG